MKNLHKYYGAEYILRGLTFNVYKGEKVGLLGKNGAGKTTLFKILSGIEDYDEGTINLSQNTAMLDQIPEYPENFTVLDVLKTSFRNLIEIKEDMKILEENMSTQAKTIKIYGDLQNEFETMGGYTMDSNIAKICNGLKIDKDMQNRLYIYLSGGEKTRVNLGKIILQNPDVLLLDEPTNHLDINMTEWLEEYLSQYKGTVLVISHDRYFLDKVVDRIIEIVDGDGEFYEGNYSFYVKEKELRYLQRLQQYEQEQRKIKQLEKAAKRLHQWANSANNPSMHKRAFAIEKRIERMDKIARPKKSRGIKSTFKEAGFSSKDVVIIDSLCKSFGSKLIIDEISLTIGKGDKIGLIGDNGCGKTTLLNLIMGSETPDSGFSRLGKNIRYALLPQTITFDNPELTVLDTIRDIFNVSEEVGRNCLASYHFKGEEVFKQVDSLSGGERCRLKLCILMNKDMDFLILDEPTNHLDIASREWVEEAISRYQGTLLFVSHDRYLVNRFATRIWDMDNGKISDFRGTYGSYRKWKTINMDRISEVKKDDTEKNKKLEGRENFEGRRQNSRRKRQITAKLRDIEKEISILEEKLKDIGLEMEKKASDYKHLQTLLGEKEEIDIKLEESYTKWEEFNELSQNDS